MNGGFPGHLIQYTAVYGPVNRGRDYNVIKNFNGIKIIGWITIYNISPDIVSE